MCHAGATAGLSDAIGAEIDVSIASFTCWLATLYAIMVICIQNTRTWYKVKDFA